MKKIVAMLLILSTLLTASCAFAEGMGVQVIGGPQVEIEPVSLDDIKIDVPFSIDEYGDFVVTSFTWLENLEYFRLGTYTHTNYASGADAEYALLKFDITNVMLRSKNFLENVSVKAVYDDLYEYAGWFYQYDHNHKIHYSNDNNRDIVILPDEFFSIDPMYTGHYCFGCTLPNAVVEGKKSLKLIITIDGNELTYNIRK